MTRNRQGVNAYRQAAERIQQPSERDKAQLFEEYKKRIYQLAHRLMERVPPSMPLEFEDLVSYGAMGLFDAVERFDPEQDNQFSTFADYRIRGAMWDAIRSLDQVSRYTRDQAKEIEHARERLEDVFGRPPTASEMATEMGRSVDEFFILEGKVQSVQHVSIDFDDSEGGRSFLETFADEHQLTGEELVMQDDFREQVRQAISELSDRKRDCILLYYGRNLNLSEIAAVFDITSSRVSQILSAARIELKANLQEVASLYGFVTDEIE